MRMLLAFLIAVVLALAATTAARADIGVRLDTTSGRPGDRIRADGSALYLSLYFAPAATVPGTTSCDGRRASCAPTSLGPPRRANWVWLGRFFPNRPSFHFRVPRVDSGLYRTVVYCAPCMRGPRGSLIAGSQLFRVR